MRPQSCKSKGRRLQKEIVSKILQHFPDLTDDDVRSCSMGSNGEDVQLSPKAREKVPFSIEAKNTERLNLWGSLEQAHANARACHPMLVFRKNKSKTYAVVELDVLLRLLVQQHSDSELPCETIEDVVHAMKRTTDQTSSLLAQMMHRMSGLTNAPPKDDEDASP